MFLQTPAPRFRSSLGFGSRLEASEHEFVDFICSHADQGDGLDLILAQAGSSKGTALVRCKALDLVGGLRLIRIDPSASPEPASACDGQRKAVITKSLGLQPCS